MSVITERFEVEREVGTGGMGTVFRALDRETGASVALKVLQKQLHSETERFLLEARVLAQLQHPAIVRYIAHGVTSEGAPFIAMEWLEGEDLWARLQQRVFTVEETVLLARRLAEALASAHAQGIVHRDIKPSNIFLEHGEV
ncbi:MAG: serine/threonine protein kinase, partial [Polyangiaceae bacterium]|nr:serine/threonine protein kinase [Polyangiaceae bacterium]